MVEYKIISKENCQAIFIKGKGLIELADREAKLELNNNEVKELRELGEKYNFDIVKKGDEPKKVEKPETDKEDAEKPKSKE